MEVLVSELTLLLKLLDQETLSSTTQEKKTSVKNLLQQIQPSGVLHTHTHSQTHAHAHTHVCTHVHMRTHTNSGTHKDTQTLTHTHTHTHTLVRRYLGPTLLLRR